MPRAAFSQIVNRSMSEVLTRSLITGLSTVFLIGVLLIFGGETLQDFAFAMMVGVASGTYSSIFIASPVLTAWKEREPAYRSRRGADRGGDGAACRPSPRTTWSRASTRSSATSRTRLSPTARDGATGSRTRRRRRPRRRSPSPTRRSSAPRRSSQPPRRPATGSPGAPMPTPSGRASARSARRSGRSSRKRRRKHGRIELDGAVRLVHDRGRPLALHRLPPRPLLGRDRRRASRRRDRGRDHRSVWRRSPPATRIGETDSRPLLVAIPGTLIGLAVVYWRSASAQSRPRLVEPA